MGRDGAARRALSVLLALGVWQLAAHFAGPGPLIASPAEVLTRLWQLAGEGGFWATVGFSLGRIAAGFGLALAVSVPAAFAAGRFPLIETLLWPWVTAVKAVPVASFIILSLLWLRAEQLAVFIAFLMGFPILYSNLLQGLRSMDGQLAEMVRLFRIGPGRRLVYLCLPQLRPYLLSACGTALGLCWKAGVAAEVIGVVNGSIGEKLYEAKIYLETADLFAWTLVIVLAGAACEKLAALALRLGFERLEKR